MMACWLTKMCPHLLLRQTWYSSRIKGVRVLDRIVLTGLLQVGHVILMISIVLVDRLARAQVMQSLSEQCRSKKHPVIEHHDPEH